MYACPWAKESTFANLKNLFFRTGRGHGNIYTMEAGEGQFKMKLIQGKSNVRDGVVYVCNLRTWKVETGGWNYPSQPVLYIYIKILYLHK